MKKFFTLTLFFCLNLNANVDFDNIKKIAKQVNKEFIEQIVDFSSLKREQKNMAKEVVVDTTKNLLKVDKESKIAKFIAVAVNALIKEKRSVRSLLGSDYNLNETEFNVLISELSYLGYEFEKFGDNDYLISVTWKSFCKKLHIAFSKLLAPLSEEEKIKLTNDIFENMFLI